jgi:transcriptional regulator with XRE-family HTH domain
MKTNISARLEMGERLAAFRASIGESQKSIGERTGIPWRTYQNYEVGSREVTAGALLKLAEKYQLNPTWVVTGQLPILLIDVPEIARSLSLEMEDLIERESARLPSKKRADIFAKLFNATLRSEPTSSEELENWVDLARE